MVNQELLDCINRVLQFNSCGECYSNTPISFCTIHTKVIDHNHKEYELIFDGLLNDYDMKVPLEQMDYKYVLDSIKKNLKIFMENYAEHLIKTELEESETL